MKKLESFLNNYSWLLKLGIGIAIIFWAAQASIVAVDVYHQGKEKERMYSAENYMERERAINELKEFSRQVIHEASITSRQGILSPAGFFEDIKKIRLKNKELYYRSLQEDLRSKGFDYIRSLNEIYKPVGLLYKDEKYLNELEVSLNSYRKWVAMTDVHKEGGDDSLVSGINKINQQEANSILSSLGKWLTVLYCRSFLLIMLLYLIRMAQRKGILGTILADKKKFVSAMIMWPIFVGKYPYNVVREIVVEAELRRIGNLFRKLSPKEKLKIEAIANSDGYKAWIQKFRTENKLRFQNCFLLALAVTIIIHVLLPVLANSAETHLARGDPLIIEQVAEDAAKDFSGSNCPDDGADSACILEVPPAVALYVSEKIRIISETARRIRRSKKIDQIPLEWLFSCDALISN